MNTLSASGHRDRNSCEKFLKQKGESVLSGTGRLGKACFSLAFLVSGYKTGGGRLNR